LMLLARFLFVRVHDYSIIGPSADNEIRRLGFLPALARTRRRKPCRRFASQPRAGSGQGLARVS